MMFSEVDTMYHVYIDAEFDAVKINRKFHQMVISLGAVMTDQEGTFIDEFYTLVKPYGFSRLTNIVKRITRIDDEMIKSADTLHVAQEHFKNWINTYALHLDDVCFYSFGPDDRRTIIQNCKELQLDKENMFAKIMDIQHEISRSVTFQGVIISPTLSLDDLKAVYHIPGAVDHNALRDAKDLMYIHQAYLQKSVPDVSKTAAIVERKIAKQLEVQKKQSMRLARIMKKRFYQFQDAYINVVFYPEVIEQFQLWEDRIQGSVLHWEKEGMMYENDCYTYDSLQMQMHIDVDHDVPSVTLQFLCKGKQLKKQFPLEYRNAIMVENIIKRLQ